MISTLSLVTKQVISFQSVTRSTRREVSPLKRHIMERTVYFGLIFGKLTSATHDSVNQKTGVNCQNTKWPRNLTSLGFCRLFFINISEWPANIMP